MIEIFNLDMIVGGTIVRELSKTLELYPGNNKINLSTLQSIIKSVSKESTRYKLSLLTFISEKNPISIFNEWQPGNVKIAFKEHDDFTLISLKRKIQRGKKREVNGTFGVFPSSFPNIWHCFTSESPDFFTNGVQRFIESYKPEISKFFLSSEEMRSTFEKFEDEHNCRVFSKKAVMYSHKEEGQINYHNRKPYNELFNEAENEDRYIDKIEFEMIKDHKSIYHGFISRDGIAYYYSGEVAFLFNDFLLSFANSGKRKSEIFKGKERKIGEMDIHPIDIVYSKNVFDNASDNYRLLHAISGINRSAITVFHKNPYVHLSFLDFVDGSNFDVFVTDSNKISIIPNFKCSVHSLMRVSCKILEDFGEGEIKSSTEPEYAIDDFIGD